MTHGSRKIFEEYKNFMTNAIESNPRITLKELQERLAESFSLSISRKFG